ncbi:MAG: LptF/LptG family permease [Verrucomicrobiales bacterium]|nr:LptF/LptG family permease [Verrucomicrobiales bacterium]
MRLLDRYLLRELVVPLGYCLGLFVVFWAAFDLLGEIYTYRELNLTFLDVAQYYLIRAPQLLVTVIPIALLLALLYALTNHARHQELTAMRAAGVSLWRLCAPYLGVGAAFTVGVFLLNELWVPRSLAAANSILTRRGGKLKDQVDPRWARDLTFFNERDKRLWNIGLYDRKTGRMWLPNVEWWTGDGGRHRVAAAQASYTNRVWRFEDVRELHSDPDGESRWQRSETNRLELADWNETPEQIDSEIVFMHLTSIEATERPQMSIRQILNYQQLHPDLRAERRAKLKTQLHARIAEPWTSLVVVLIAIPFGTPSGRRNVFVGVASSIFIAFVYFVLNRFALALGTGGYLPALLAAWLPNLAFAGTGIWLTRRVR